MPKTEKQIAIVSIVDAMVSLDITPQDLFDHMTKVLRKETEEIKTLRRKKEQ